MKKAAGVCAFTALFFGAGIAQEAPQQSESQMVPTRAANAEGIAVVKYTANLFKGMQNDPTPWECEPTLLYAATYPLSQHDMDFVLDFCSVLSLSKRGAIGSNIFDVSDNVARERPKTEQKLQRYRDTKQFFLEVSSMRLAYQGTRGQYQLSWHVPRLEVLNRATYGLMSEYASELRSQANPNFAPNRFSSAALAEDYKHTGMEFFDRKYGRGASVSLNQPLPWPTIQQISIKNRFQNEHGVVAPP